MPMPPGETFAHLMRASHRGLPAPDDEFAARRTFAEALRRTIEAAVARAASPEAFRAAARALEGVASGLEEARERLGILSQMADGGMLRFVQVAAEINPISGNVNPLAPPLEMWRDDARAWGRVRFGSAYEGPPGHVHGGWVAAAFDQFLGFVQCIAGAGGVTGKLELRYVRPTPLHTELTFEGAVKERVGRLTYVSGKLRAGDVVTAKAKAMFVDIAPGDGR